MKIAEKKFAKKCKKVAKKFGSREKMSTFAIPNETDRLLKRSGVARKDKLIDILKNKYKYNKYQEKSDVNFFERN